MVWWWCVGLSSVAPSLVLYSVAPSLVLYSVAPTHCLTHHLSLTHHSRQSIGWSISLSLKLLHSLIYTRYPSSYHSHGVLLPPCHMVSYYHQVFSHNLCSHSLSSLIHKCSHWVFSHTLVLPIITLHTTRSTNHYLMVSTTCALIVIPHTQVISHGVLPLIVFSLLFSLSVLSHSMVSYYHQLTHTLSLMFSLSDLTTSSHQLISLTLSLMISFSPTHLTYQCYPCMSSLTSGHSLPWCPTSPTDHELPEHSLTPTHLTTDHSHSPIVIPALLVLTKSLLSHTMSTHSC